MQGIRSGLIPFVWAEEGGGVTPAIADQLKGMLLTPVKWIKRGIALLTIIMPLIFLITLLFTCTRGPNKVEPEVKVTPQVKPAPEENNNYINNGNRNDKISIISESVPPTPPPLPTYDPVTEFTRDFYSYGNRVDATHNGMNGHLSRRSMHVNGMNGHTNGFMMNGRTDRLMSAQSLPAARITETFLTPAVLHSNGLVYSVSPLLSQAMVPLDGTRHSSRAASAASTVASVNAATQTPGRNQKSIEVRNNKNNSNREELDQVVEEEDQRSDIVEDEEELPRDAIVSELVRVMANGDVNQMPRSRKIDEY